jgi:hypothetical protein
MEVWGDNSKRLYYRCISRPELHRVRNYIASGITSCPELHCVQKYNVCGITHTHSVHIKGMSCRQECPAERNVLQIPASASDDVFGCTTAGGGAVAAGH